MAASRFIEQETGTYTGFRHQHNGYYAGDFSQSYRSGSERRVSNGATAHRPQNRRQPANCVYRTLRSTPEVLLEDTAPAAASARAITEVISSVRTGTSLPSS